MIGGVMYSFLVCKKKYVGQNIFSTRKLFFKPSATQDKTNNQRGAIISYIVYFNR